MATEQDLRDDLLKQNGHDSRRPSALSDEVLARDEMQVKRLKRIVSAGWVVFLVSVVIAAGVGVIARPPQEYFVPTVVIVVQGLLLIAVILSVSLYVRSRTLTMHQIQARLARIEEQLRIVLRKE